MGWSHIRRRIPSFSRRTIWLGALDFRVQSNMTTLKMGLPAPKALFEDFSIEDVDEAVKSSECFSLCLRSCEDTFSVGLFGRKASSKNDHY